MKKTYKVKLNEVDRLQKFVNGCAAFDNITVAGKHEPFVVDAKSVMGLLSFDLTEPVIIEAAASTEEELESFDKWITGFNGQYPDD